MSYCRLSDNCYQCDVYCYQGEDGGYRVFVAGARYENDAPRPTIPARIDDADDWVEYYHNCREWVKQAEPKPISLPCDDKSYSFDTAKECAQKLIELRSMGYRVPQMAIDALMEETN